MTKLASLAVLCLGLCLSAWAGAANARPLTGVQEIKLNVSPLGHYGKQCGLTREAFERALLGSIPEGDIRLSNSSSYWLHTRVTTVVFEEINCVSNVEVTLYANTRYYNPATQQELSGRVELWRGGGLYSSVNDSHQVQVNSALRKLGRKLYDAWKKDQL
ncbi:hypothetical protein WH96_13145 [Kiloniella spongiae]|uniref:Lipoprotein n=1 Tax=Kiloniella spongiae TaxID=1489064 RepID=A0A0H2MHA4_9PROT|nr:hypothetical protein [Kiloniella spongiae]KLN60132.1 hypothetical protein WH96_13145 [Kiloniella spongiae]